MALSRLFGCVRVVFNDGLRARQQARIAGEPWITDAELSARLTAAKATPERAWLAKVSAVPGLACRLLARAGRCSRPASSSWSRPN